MIFSSYKRNSNEMLRDFQKISKRLKLVNYSRNVIKFNLMMETLETDKTK